jgi:RNA polymerase sigma factor (sigma-70 family)
MIDAAEHVGLVWSIVHRTGPHEDEDDVFGNAQYGLVKACRDFDETRGLQFSTIATKYIRIEIQKHYRVKHAKKRDAARTTSLGDVTGLKVGRWDQPTPIERQDEDLDRILEVENILCRLPEHLVEILLARAEGMTLDQIASKIGVGRETVRKREHEAFRLAQLAVNADPVFLTWNDVVSANSNRRKRLGFPVNDKSKPTPREMVRY